MEILTKWKYRLYLLSIANDSGAAGDGVGDGAGGAADGIRSSYKWQMTQNKNWKV